MRMTPFSRCYALLIVLTPVANASAESYDYFRNARFPGERRTDVSLDKVEDAQGGAASGYHRRTVQWWPKQGVDVVQIPEGVPLRTWTINPASLTSPDPKQRKWWPRTLRGVKQFNAHLIGFRGLGMGIGNPWKRKDETSAPDYYCPAAVLRLEDGRKRCFTSGSFVEADERYLCDLYEKEMKRLRDSTFEEGIQWKVNPRHNSDFPPGDLYRAGTAQIESEHFVAVLGSEDPNDAIGSRWLIDDDREQAARNRMMIMRGWEDWWAYQEYAGHLMPYWEKPDPVKFKYKILVGGTKKNGVEILSRGAGGSYGGMSSGDGNWWGMYHEWTHGQLHGGMISLGGGETMCDAAQTMGDPRVIQKMMFQVVKPWKNLFWGAYPGGYAWTNMGDDPNWGYCAVGVIPPMMTDREHTPMHAIARLGERRGIFKNGIRGMGDFMGQIGARMAEFDTELQAGLRQTFTMPTRVSLRTIDPEKRLYRSPVMYSPEPFGLNIVRLVPDKGAKKLTVDFQGHFDAETFSDWRACIVAVDAEGRCRYSPLWNKGTISLEAEPGDLRHWLTVTATPYALTPSHPTGMGSVWTVYQGGFAFRYPYDVQLAGCRPGSPHTTLEEDDVLTGVGGVWGMRRGEGANCANIPATSDSPGYAAMRKALEGDEDPVSVAHLENSRGHRHRNGGGWVARSATVDETAYVAPGAMVLDGAKVLGNTVINDYAIVTGAGVTVKDNARVYGKVIVDDTRGTREYSGAARVYRRDEGQEDVFLDKPQQRANQLGLTASRFFGRDIRLQANYECDVPDAAILEDYFKEHSTDVFFYGAHRADLIFFDGVLRGRPGFVENEQGGSFTFNGKDQYAELPGEVADLEETSLNIRFKHAGVAIQTLYEFFSSAEHYLRLTCDKGALKLTASDGKTIVSATADVKVPANRWTVCRVEIDGKKIAMCVNDRTVATAASDFRASDAFAPGLPRLGFLGAGRHGSKPLTGAVDFFRVYTTVFKDFGDAAVPLVAPRNIPAGYVERFTKTFPDYDNMVAEAEVSATSHPLTAYYAKYNAAIQARLSALRSTLSPEIEAMEKRLDSLSAELDEVERQVKVAEQNDEDFKALKQAMDRRRSTLQKQLQAIYSNNERCAAATKVRDETQTTLLEAQRELAKKAATSNPEYIKLHQRQQAIQEELRTLKPTDPRVRLLRIRQNNLNKAKRGVLERMCMEDPELKKVFLENKKATTASSKIRNSIVKSGEGRVINEQIIACRVEFKPDAALMKKLSTLQQEVQKQEAAIEKAKVDVAVAANPAEYRALQRTLYFGKAYERTVKKALLAAVPKPTDDIAQVRMAQRYQSQEWHTAVDWDGRAAYEKNPDSVRQPVMQMWLKKMKPWMYK